MFGPLRFASRPAPAATPVDYTAATPAERLDAIAQLAGALSAIQAELGDLIVAADEAGDWRADGATGVAAWLMAHCGLARRTATRWAETAHHLTDLPAIRALLASGRLSLDQVAPAAPVITPDTEAEMARLLPGWSARQIECWARRQRRPDDQEAATAHARRSFTWRDDHRRGGCRYSGFLPHDMAAAVNTALTKIAGHAGPDPATGLWDPEPTRLADALHALCGGQTATPEITIHVDATSLLRLDGAAAVIGAAPLAEATVLRHLCDSKIEHAVTGPDGTTTIGIGRQSRTPPGWLRRSIIHRDQTCRFPGCDRTIHQVHHMRHWTRDKGPTDAWNLIGLCYSHHSLMHEGGWEATGNGDHHVTFTSPFGRQLTSARRPLRDTTRTSAATLTSNPNLLQPPPTEGEDCPDDTRGASP